MFLMLCCSKLLLVFKIGTDHLHVQHKKFHSSQKQESPQWSPLIQPRSLYTKLLSHSLSQFSHILSTHTFHLPTHSSFSSLRLSILKRKLHSPCNSHVLIFFSGVAEDKRWLSTAGRLLTAVWDTEDSRALLRSFTTISNLSFVWSSFSLTGEVADDQSRCTGRARNRKTTHALRSPRVKLQTPFLYVERVPIVSRVRHLASLDYNFFQQSLEEPPQRKQKMRPSSELASFSRTC